jgi:hypothetical protein
METLFAFLFIFARCLIPPVFLFVNVYNIIKRKEFLKKAGENIILKNTKKLPGIFIIFYIIVAIAGLIRLIISTEWIYIIAIIFFLFMITTIISINLYSNINGIYRNGLIINEYITWEKVHSYKWINEETISFLLMQGNRIDFNKITNREKIFEIITANKIIENNK